MTILEANEVLDIASECEEISCSCHMGHPPCGVCERMPASETIEEARLVLKMQDWVSGEFAIHIRNAILMGC